MRAAGTRERFFNEKIDCNFLVFGHGFMTHRIIDLMTIIAADPQALRSAISSRLKEGWQLHGETKQMHLVTNLAVRVNVQWMVLLEDAD